MLTEERKREILASVGAWPRTPKKPKPTVVAEVSEKVAAAARANPESVRVSAKAVDETIVVERARRSEVIDVLEVDAQGRPSVAWRTDLETGQRSIMQFAEGYRAPSGAVHQYDPMAALKRGDGDE
jgi:hypothetical protein